MISKNSNKTQYEFMTETPITQLVIRLGIPTIITMLVSSFYNIADTYFVGSLGTSASGAIGIVFGLMCIIQAVGFLFGQGGGSIVSRKLGSNNIADASRFTSISFYASIIVGLLITIFGLIFIKPFMYLLGSTDTIYPYAKTYATYILLSSSLMMGSFVLNNVLRYEGQSIYAMIGLSIGALLNIAGDYILIFGFDMGITGAGLSTAISQSISFLILLYFVLRGKTQSKIGLKYVTNVAPALKEITVVGFPSLVRQGLVSVSSMLLNHQAALYGDVAIAAMSVVNRIVMFVFSVGLGISQGFQPVCGFNYGAKKYTRVKKSFFTTVIISEFLLGFLALIGIIFAPELIYMFLKDPEVLDIGVFALRAQLVVLLLHPTILATSMMLQSTGWSKQATLLSGFRSGFFFIPLIIILPFFIGIKGIQLAQPLADICSFICTFPFLMTFLKDINEKVRNHEGE